jgi:hypothetical protein
LKNNNNYEKIYLNKEYLFDISKTHIEKWLIVFVLIDGEKPLYLAYKEKIADMYGYGG